AVVHLAAAVGRATGGRAAGGGTAAGPVPDRRPRLAARRAPERRVPERRVLWRRVIRWQTALVPNAVVREVAMAEEFDVVVIGAGPAGENVVDRAVRGGLSAAVVEERLAGGECSYWACIPSKALLRPVELAAEVARVPGLEAGPIDTRAVLARRDEAVGGYDDSGQVQWVESVPATFVRGRGRLDGPRRVVVATPDGGERVLTARH